jgi:hypothetical protein
MGEKKKKEFEKIDIEELKVEQQASPVDVDKALKEIAENIEKKKKMKL